MGSKGPQEQDIVSCSKRLVNTILDRTLTNNQTSIHTHIYTITETNQI